MGIENMLVACPPEAGQTGVISSLEKRYSE
jgi:hypothetical protein